MSARTITLAPKSSARLPSKPVVAVRTKLLLESPILGHIVVSPVLIFGWGPIPCLGPAGSGWGLMLSFAARSLVLFAYLRSPPSLARLRFRGASLQWPLLRDILKVGVDGHVNATRVVLSAGCALIAIYWLQLGASGLFISIAAGFCAYAALTLLAIWRVKAPPAGHAT